MKMTPQEVAAHLSVVNEEAVIYDGFEECLVGVCYQFGRPTVAAYDYDLCIKTLMERDGMSQEDAIEFFDFNTLGLSVGENTPVFIATDL